MHMSDGLGCFGDQLRAAIDQAAVDLHHVRTCTNLADRICAAHDAAYTDDGVAAAERRSQLANDLVAGFQHGSAGQSASFFGVLQALDGFAADGGVGGNHAIHAMAL